MSDTKKGEKGGAGRVRGAIIPGGGDAPSTTDVSTVGMDSGAEKKAGPEPPSSSSPPSPRLPTAPPVETGEEAVLAVEPDEIPNGGLRAWLQVAGGFALFFNSWGIVNTFGVYQTYYETNLLRHSSPDAISWVGSIQGFLLLGCGAISGPLFDAGFFRALVATGTFFVSFGFMMTSLATQYWHVLLGQAFCLGLGAGCLVVPTLAVLPQYFTSKRALVIGIAVVGSSLGGVVYPLIFTSLVGRIGFGWTNRVLGFIALSTCAFAVSVMRPRARPRKVRSLVDPAAFREPPYIFYCGAMFCSNLGFFVPVFYLQTYALTHGVSDRNLALNLIAILNAASVLGRLAPSLFVHLIGPVNTMIAVATMAGAVTFCWVAVNDVAGNVVFAVLYGFSSGGIVSLPAVVLTSITSDLSFLGARMGTANFFNAIGSLIGPPIAGAILKSRNDYLGLQLFAAFAISGTSICLFCVRLARAGSGVIVKV